MNDNINEAVAKLHIIRLMQSYSLNVDDAVDKLLSDYHSEMDIGIIIQAGEILKKEICNYQ